MSDPVRDAERWEELNARLRRSSFRLRFVLGKREFAYLESRGFERIREHAARFVDERLAPAAPVHDGRQTPMRGHPVFIAQHATGTCCRRCLRKWHWIPEGRELTRSERRYVTDVIVRWLAESSFPHLQSGAELAYCCPIPARE